MPSMYGDLDRPPLHADALRRALVTPDALWTEVEVVDRSPSTNAELGVRARTSDDDGVVLVAEHQTAGRGRLDRTWTTPARSGLTLSILVRPTAVEPVRWPWLPLMAGLVVAASLRDQAGVAAAVKWPNDVIVDDRKVAGILVERIDGAGRAPAAVVGIGLNVSLREDELPVPTATSLVLEQATMTDRSQLARALLRNFDRLYVRWLGTGGDPGLGLQAAYVDACATIGRRVRVELVGGQVVTGHAVGVDPLGRLLVRTPQGEQTFGAGDVVHLRRAT
ncbi:MAG: biotin--[acetyl-CoA-carboxylase] ligase [Nocardioidaceae bacterium]|nr:biotin--[acetyl-CoA-carboxylase] ligase [Nocardioidaceae bacterium]